MKRALFLTMLFFFWLHAGSQNQNTFKKSNERLWNDRYSLALQTSNDNFIYAVYLPGEFRGNEFKADAKYKDKIISVSGFVNRVQKDNNGRYFVVLASHYGSEISDVIIYFKPSETSSLGNLSYRQPIIITGTCIGKEKDGNVYIINAQINYKELQRLDEYVQREVEVILEEEQIRRLEAEERYKEEERKHREREAELERKAEEGRKQWEEEQRRPVNPFSNSTTGTGGGGASASFNISGRSLVGGGGLPRPDYTSAEQGRIVINITVDPNGNVIAAEIGRGTNIDNASMRSSALNAARRAKFNNIQGNGNQSGTITYNWVLR